MVFGKKIKLIKKYLQKKKETPVLEIIIRDYNNANFYMAIIYAKKIEKFKTLFIPLDVIENVQIEEYTCYQFMSMREVENVLVQLETIKEKYQAEDTRNNLNKNITNFYIEINILLDKELYNFKTTRYLPKDWKFLFEPVVTIFEHLPNIMSQLGEEILSVIMNTEDQIDYQSSLSCDLFQDDIDKLFTNATREKGLTYFNEGRINFLERVNGKYFAIINNHLVIVEYNKHQKILNLFCDSTCYIYGEFVYAVLMAIKNDQFKKFYKISVIKNNKGEKSNYLCYGATKNALKVIKGSKLAEISKQLWKDGNINILEDENNQLIEALKETV